MTAPLPWVVTVVWGRHPGRTLVRRVTRHHHLVLELVGVVVVVHVLRLHAAKVGIIVHL